MNSGPSDVIRAWTTPEEAASRLRTAGWIVHHVSIGTLRQKSSIDAVLSMEVTPAEGAHPIPVMIRISPDPELDLIEQKWATLRPVPSVLGPGIIRAGAALALSWPNDIGLRSLRHIANVDRFKRLLAELPAITEGRFRVRGSKSTIEIIRWKPERRVVARARLACIDDVTREHRDKVMYVRVWPDARGRELLNILQELGKFGLRIPQPVGELLDGSVSVESEVLGVNLFDRFLASPSLELARPLGRLLGQLHRIEAAQAPVSNFDMLLGAPELVRALSPGLSPRFERLSRSLGSVPAGSKWIHGDLHLRQFLVDKDGIGIVDFERAGRGSPEVDMGLLLANLDDMALRHPHCAPLIPSFITELVAEWNKSLVGHDRIALRNARIRGLLALAVLPLRRAEPDAEQLAEHRLKSAEALFDRDTKDAPRADDWDCLYPKPKAPWAARLADGRAALYDPHSSTLTPVLLRDDPIMSSHQDLVAQGRLLAHRAHGRAVFRLPGTPPTYVKIVAPKRSSDLDIRIHETDHLRAAHGIEFPRLLAADAARGRFTFAELAGVPWHDELMRGDFTSHQDLVASALARLHAIPASPNLPMAGRPTLDEVLGYVSAAAPSLRATFEKAAAKLPRAPSLTGNATLHGDLHDRNILIDDSTVRFLDPDSLRSGPREEDEGNLSAHVLLRALMIGESVVQATTRAVEFELRMAEPSDAARNRLLVDFRRHSLFRIAAIHLFRKPWSYLVPALLDAAVG